jgi:hypothetical protein
MNDIRTPTRFNSGGWREFLCHKLAHEGALPCVLISSAVAPTASSAACFGATPEQLRPGGSFPRAW